jgi:hypothetical protein
MKSLILALLVLLGSQAMAEEATENREPASTSAPVNLSDPAMETNRGTDLQAQHVSEIGCPDCARLIGRSNIGEPIILNGKQFYNLMPDEPVSAAPGSKAAPASSGVKEKYSPNPKKK